MISRERRTFQYVKNKGWKNSEYEYYMRHFEHEFRFEYTETEGSRAKFQIRMERHQMWWAKQGIMYKSLESDIIFLRQHENPERKKQKIKIWIIIIDGEKGEFTWMR